VVTGLMVASWLTLAAAGVFAAGSGVFSPRAFAWYESVKSGALLFVAFVGWVGISGSLNSIVRNWFVRQITRPWTRRIVTFVTFGGATALFVAGLVTKEIVLDCSGTTDGQAIVNGELDPKACTEPIHVRQNSQIAWRSALGQHPPKRVAELPVCHGRTLLCDPPYALSTTVVSDEGAKRCPSAQTPRTWRVDVEVPLGFPRTAY
jgi:hypothetical protein